MASRSWEKEARTLSPVFITGTARSGTSILYRSIQNHPTFLPAAGPDLVEAKAMTLLLELFRREDVQPGGLANFLMSFDALTAVARDIEPLARRRAFVRRLARGDIAPPAPLWLWKAAGEHHVVRRYFLEAHRRRGAKRLVEKTPNYVRYVPHLRSAFPRARFICIIRHPLDVLTSYRKRYELDPEGSAWANLTPDVFCSRWEGVTREAVMVARSEPSFLLVRYEDFTGSTESTVRRMLEHVGEPFDEACLLQGPDEEPPEAYAKSMPEARRKAYSHLFSSVSERTKRWEDHVDLATAQYVEGRVQDTMVAAGYEPKTRPAGAPTAR